MPKRSATNSSARSEAVDDGVATVVLDEAGRCVDANPAACRALGVTREEVVGAPVGERGSLGADLKTAWEVFRRMGSREGEWRVIRPDGTTRVLLVSSAQGAASDRPLTVLRCAPAESPK